MSPYFAASLILLYVSILLTNLEYLKVKSIFASEGLLSWKTLSLRNRVFTFKPLFQFFDIIYNRSLSVVFIAMFFLSVTGICIVIFFNKYQLFPIFFAQVVALNAILLFYNYRSRYALDGADQFNTISLTCLSLCLLINAQNFEHFFLLFIAFQLTLSYFIAGLFKIFSSKWLSGNAIKDVFSGQVYGNTFITGIFKRFPWLALVLSTIIITWEFLFPLCFFLNETFFLGFLGVGIMFHLFNAIFMGLNCFLISFVSGYPALVYCYYLIR